MGDHDNQYNGGDYGDENQQYGEYAEGQYEQYQEQDGMDTSDNQGGDVSNTGGGTTGQTDSVKEDDSQKMRNIAGYCLGLKTANHLVVPTKVL